MTSFATAAVIASVLAAPARWITGAYEAPSARDGDALYADARMPVLRKTFSVPAERTQATLRLASPGMRDVFVNGHRVTETALPQWTASAKRVYVDEYDVTRFLRPGENELRIELGNGWWNPLPLKMWTNHNLRQHLATGTPCVRAALELKPAGGEARTIVTDATWEAADGTVVRNSVYLGERRDLRLAPAAWRSARETRGPAGAEALRADAPDTVVYHVRPAQKVTRLHGGEIVVDFGTNAAGSFRARLRGVRAGDVVTFRSGELLHTNGTVNTLTACCGQIKDPAKTPPGVAEQCDSLVAGADGDVVFEPRFAFHSFRYVQVAGLRTLPTEKDFEALDWSADVRERSSFECSNPDLNLLHAMCRRTFRSNLMGGVQSDCPGREKFGYGGDIAATAESFCFNWEMRGFYRKVVRDFLDEAAEDGFFTETAPYVGLQSGGFGTDRGGPIGWTLAVPVMMDCLLRFDGDRAIVEEAYPALARYVELCRRTFPKHLVPLCIGDHEAVEKADPGYTATMHYREFVRYVAKFAHLLGRSSDAVKYERLAADIAAAVRQRYWRGHGRYANGYQGDQAFALQLGLVSGAGERVKSLNLVKKDIEKHGTSLTTGIFATPYLLDYLSRHGESALAGRLVTNANGPGWMRMMKEGATSLWEHWDRSESVYSWNHPMFGSVDGWLFAHVLGVSVEPDAVGGSRIRIDPKPVAGVTWAKGHLDTPRGRITLAWKLRTDGTIDLHADVPDGITVVRDDSVPFYRSRRQLAENRSLSRDEALERLRDDSVWVRVRASATLAKTARGEDGEQISSALRSETNRVVRLYLEDALARSGKGETPAPRAAANPIVRPDGSVRTWLCGYGDRCETSPFDAYYTCAVPRKPTPELRRAHAAGKVVMPRPLPTEWPGLAVTDKATAERFKAELDRELPDDILEVTDAVVYGEETMNPDPAFIWDTAWRAFCEEAGIDPARVRGEYDNLTDSEKLAYEDWGYRVAIEGFNEIYEFTHLYFGRLRPGLKVCTFFALDKLSRYHRDWKFDLAGTYSYAGDMRWHYARVKAFRSLWPDRPVVWLSGGNVNCNIYTAGAPTHRSYLPPGPLAYRWDRPYADNLVVWMAGGDPGYFAYNFFRRQSGTYGFSDCAPETLYPGSPRFEKGIEITFRDREGEFPSLTAFSNRVERFRNGFLYQQRFMDDTASAIGGLPRLQAVGCRGLVIGDANGVYSPAAMLMDDFDYHGDLTMPTLTDAFDGYRLVTTWKCEWGRKMDAETRAAWIAWMRDRPNALVICGDLPRGRETLLPTRDGFRESVYEPWPWENDIVISNRPGLNRRYFVSGPRAKVLASDSAGATRVLWRDPAFKSLVLFDYYGMGREATETCRKLVGGHFAAQGVDYPFSRTPGLLTRASKGVQAYVLADKSWITNRLSGCELVTGQWDPILTPKLNAALVAEEYEAPRVAVHAGVCLLAERPFDRLEKTVDGFRVRSAGVVRVTARPGLAVRVTDREGRPLKPVSGDPSVWFIRGTTAGIARLPERGTPEKGAPYEKSGTCFEYFDTGKPYPGPTIDDRADTVPAAWIFRSSDLVVVSSEKQKEKCK